MLKDQEDIHKQWQFYFKVNKKTAPVGHVWEAYKLHIRTILSSRINRIKASSNLILDQASDKVDLLTKEFHKDPTQDRAATLHTHLLDQLHYEKAKKKLFFLKQRVFEQGERAGKLLAYLAHQDTNPPVVVTLTDTRRWYPIGFLRSILRDTSPRTFEIV